VDLADYLLEAVNTTNNGALRSKTERYCSTNNFE